MTPGQVPINAYAGDDIGVAVTLVNKSDGSAFNMADLSELSVELHAPFEEDSPYYQIDPAVSGNVMTFTFTSAMTSALRGKQVYWRLRGQYLSRDVTLLADAFVVLDVRAQKGVADIVVTAEINLDNMAVTVVMGDAAAAAIHAKQDAKAQVALAIEQVALATQQAGIATTQAGTATTQAGIATNEAGTATQQAGVATTQANRSETEADRAVAARAEVENAVDAWVMSHVALNNATLNQLIS